MIKECLKNALVYIDNTTSRLYYVSMNGKEIIKALEKELAEVKGTTCDVYSRVVGYHSPTSHWNEGKKEEFINRGTFRVSK